MSDTPGWEMTPHGIILGELFYELPVYLKPCMNPPADFLKSNECVAAPARYIPGLSTDW